MEDRNVVRREHAQSGRVDYVKPIVIRGGPTKPTHFEVLPTFIPRSGDSEDLCLKMSYWKKTANSFKVGFPADFTLVHSEVLQLRDVIDQGLRLIGQKEGGSYLLLRLDQAESTDIQGKDAGTVGKALLKLLGSQEVIGALAGLPDAAALIEGLQVSARVSSLAAAINELEVLLSTGTNDEQTYQVWCEENSWAFGNAYAMRDAVRNIALGDSVDLLLQKTSDRLRDIFELKRPDHDVLRFDPAHKSFYWSGDVTKTIGQCHRYLDALHEAAANGLRDHPELVAYYPYATIVIGRSNDWGDEQLRALHGLNHRLHGIRVMTYDHLLAQAKQTLATLSAERSQ